MNMKLFIIRIIIIIAEFNVNMGIASPPSAIPENFQYAYRRPEAEDEILKKYYKEETSYSSGDEGEHDVKCVHVELPVGSSLKIKVPYIYRDTISFIKKHIWEDKEIPLNLQTFVCRGRLLDEDLSLKENGIHYGDVIQLLIIDPEELWTFSPYNVRVLLPNGDVKGWTIEKTSFSLDDLKELVLTDTNIPTTMQTFVYKRKILDDDFVLDLGKMGGHLLHLLMFSVDEATSPTVDFSQFLDIKMASGDMAKLCFHSMAALTVNNIKHLMSIKYGFGSPQQVLTNGGRALRDYQTLDVSGLHSGDELQFEVVSVGEFVVAGDESEMVNCVRVNLEDGRSIRVNVPDIDTYLLEDLKRAVQLIANVPMSDQCYVHKDTLLVDERSLGENGLDYGQELVMTLPRILIQVENIPKKPFRLTFLVPINIRAQIAIDYVWAKINRLPGIDTGEYTLYFEKEQLQNSLQDWPIMGDVTWAYGRKYNMWNEGLCVNSKIQLLANGQRGIHVSGDSVTVRAITHNLAQLHHIQVRCVVFEGRQLGDDCELRTLHNFACDSYLLILEAGYSSPHDADPPPGGMMVTVRPIPSAD